jgi:hypothetical protein
MAAERDTGMADGRSIIEGRSAFGAAIRDLLLALPDRAVREIWMLGEDYEGWPLDDPSVLDALSRWTRLPGRRIHMVGGDFETVQQRFPRFSEWRRHRGHLFEAWQPAQAERALMGCWLIAGSQAIELLDGQHWRARLVDDPAALRALNERAVALLHRCEPGWPITTLGL